MSAMISSKCLVFEFNVEVKSGSVEIECSGAPFCLKPLLSRSEIGWFSSFLVQKTEKWQFEILPCNRASDGSLKFWNATELEMIYYNTTNGSSSHF